MSVTLVSGDMFTSKAQTITNAVNCIGVMGGGIAYDFKVRFPDMYRDYTKRCAEHTLTLGKPYVWKGMFPPYILNFPTKHDFMYPSTIVSIIAGLQYLNEHYVEWDIASLAVPALGCGLGGLSWNRVKPYLVHELNKLNIPVEIYLPL